MLLAFHVVHPYSHLGPLVYSPQVGAFFNLPYCMHGIHARTECRSSPYSIASSAMVLVISHNLRVHVSRSCCEETRLPQAEEGTIPYSTGGWAVSVRKKKEYLTMSRLHHHTECPRLLFPRRPRAIVFLLLSTLLLMVFVPRYPSCSAREIKQHQHRFTNSKGTSFVVHSGARPMAWALHTEAKTLPRCVLRTRSAKTITCARGGDAMDEIDVLQAGSSRPPPKQATIGGNGVTRRELLDGFRSLTDWAAIAAAGVAVSSTVNPGMTFASAERPGYNIQDIKKAVQADFVSR